MCVIIYIYIISLLISSFNIFDLVFSFNIFDLFIVDNSQVHSNVQFDA